MNGVEFINLFIRNLPLYKTCLMIQNFNIISIILLGAVFLSAQQPIFVPAERPEYVKGELLVSFTDEQQKQIFEITYADRNDVKIVEELFGRLMIYLIEIPEGESEDAWSKKLKGQGVVNKVWKNYILEQRSKRPNDIDFADQYYLETIGAPDVWRFTTGGVTALGDTIVVAIIDSGFKPDHEDLEPNRFYNRHEIPGNGIDDDGNGYIDDYSGWNNITKNGELAHNSHGTQVAGIIGAKGNNQIGVTGVNWDVKLLMVSGVRNAREGVSAYNYIYIMRKLYNDTNGEKGAYIVASNASLGIADTFPEDTIDNVMWCEMYNVLGEEGILSVGATSNENKDVGILGDIPSMCTSPYLIVVTTCGEYDGLGINPTGFNNQHVDLAAPGERLWNISSSPMMDRYEIFHSTSGATPIVTGAAALLASMPFVEFAQYMKDNRAEGVLKMRELILSSTVPLEDFKDRTVTGGRLDLRDALKQILIEYEPYVTGEFKFTELFPNPCCGEDGRLNFKFEVFDLEENSLEIYDLAGKQLYQKAYAPLDFKEAPYVDLNEANIPLGSGYIIVMKRDKLKDARVFFRLR